jgi:hypothetical protein
MSVYKYILLGWYMLSALLMVSSIGKPRKPIMGGAAAVGLVILGGIATLVVLA